MRLIPSLFATALLAAPLCAATVTLDLNGFRNTTRGQVTGTGIEKPIELPADKDKIVLENLQPNGQYGVDFFHDSGEESSDFSFTVNAAGTGVESVSLGGGKYEMLDGFKPGATTLKLKVFEITVNANSGQTGQYFVAGLMEAYSVGAASGPLKVKAVPGWYPVDNLSNTFGGLEDWRFVVDDKGKVHAFGGSEEFAEFEGSSVSPRVTNVHFTIDASAPVNYHPTHEARNTTNTGNIYELDLPLTVGGGGVNIWNFGDNQVLLSDATDPEGKSIEGRKSENDFLFYPRLRYDGKKKAFYFETTKGASDTVSANAGGTVDGGASNLTVKITAKIQKPTEVKTETK